MAPSRWDFFIAHADVDSPLAEELRRALESRATVFEDSMLPVGVEWDRELEEQLRASAITVVLVSDRTSSAYYQREEIAIAIQLARTHPERHRVIPVFLGSEGDGVPYGLSIRSAIRLSDGSGMDEVVQRLLASLEDLRHPASPGPREAATEALRVLKALDAVARGTPLGADHALDDSLAILVTAATQEASAGRPDAARVAQAARRTLRTAGLDPRILVSGLPDHEVVLERWQHAAAGDLDPRELLSQLRAALARGLNSADLRGISEVTRNLLSLVLGEDGDAESPLTEAFRSALAANLSPLLSTSREVVLLRPGADAALEPPRALAVHHIAAQLCRLPPLDRFVVGREDLVATVTERLVATMSTRQAVVAALSGQPGVGASTVAIAAAHALEQHFPGAVLYLDLKGLDAAARRSPRTVIRLISEALKLDIADTAGEEELVAAYQRALEGREVLLVLDNALDAAHVQALAKPVPSCAVIVTSRNRIQDYADPEHAMRVAPLSREASARLLHAFAPTTAGGAEAIDRLARLCDDLPLALRLIGARMAARPELEPEYHADLLENDLTRLDYLAVGERAVRAAIGLSYDILDAETQHLFRFMAATPSREWTAAELAHGLEEPAATVELLLNRLADRSLAEQRIRRNLAGRPVAYFVLPDLIHLFAIERLRDEEQPQIIIAFRKRSVEFLAARLGETVGRLYEADLALELDARPHLAALRLAVEEEWFDVGVELAINLGPLFTTQRDADAFVETGDLLVRLHLARGEPEPAVRARLRDADDLTRSHRRTDLAERFLRDASALATRHDLSELDAEAQFRLSLLLASREEWEKALQASTAAFHRLTAAGQGVAAVPIALNNARLAGRIGDAAAGRRWADTGWQLASEGAADPLKASAAFELANAEAASDNHLPAIGLWRRAGDLYEREKSFKNAAIATMRAIESAALCVSTFGFTLRQMLMVSGRVGVSGWWSSGVLVSRTRGG